MEYWQELRAALGSRPLLFIGAAALIFDDAGRLLLISRLTPANGRAWAA